MGDKSSIKGLVICFLAIFVYFRFILPMIQGPPPKPDGTPQPATRRDEERPTYPKYTATSPPAQTTRPARPIETITELPDQRAKDDIVCETGLFRVVLTNRGAAIRSVTLRDFRALAKGEEKLKLITEIEKGKLSLTMAEVAGRGELDKVIWKHEPVPDSEVGEGFSRAERFLARVPELGLEVVKTFRFREPRSQEGVDRPIGGRDLEVEIRVTNRSKEPVLFKYRLRSVAGIVPEPDVPPERPFEKRQSRDVEAVVGGLADGKVKLSTYSPRKVAEKPLRHTGGEAGPIYAGVKNRYFAAVVEPLASRSEITAVIIDKIDKYNITADLEIRSENIPPGGVSTKNLTLPSFLRNSPFSPMIIHRSRPGPRAPPAYSQSPVFLSHQEIK